MRVHHMLFGILLTIVSSAAAIAEDAMPMTAMSTGDVIAVMPDGKMARAIVTDAAKLDQMRKIAKRIPWCMMFMLGADGAVYMIDTSAHLPMVECEDMVE